MTVCFTDRLGHIRKPHVVATLHALQRGIEKESLRVNSEGGIAQTPHPVGLGSALMHPNITTDYSEALLEFITPVCNSVDDVLNWLDEIHQVTFNTLDDETLWAASMPCVLPYDEGIPVAQYGSSNVGVMKTTYRLGLGHRYGRAMQTIAGIHYNFSFSDEFWQQYRAIFNSKLSLQDFKTEQYFHLIRNFRRYSWLLVYLFGASPALCKTFLGHNKHSLQEMGNGTLYTNDGTSLRMGDLGYQSDAQKELYVCYNGLEEYSNTLSGALNHPLPEYENIGTHIDGQRVQLNASLLQIENEFYSSIRPKRVALSGESPLNALNDRGVQYIEVRCLDINPYLPLGIDADEIRFVDAFLLYCLLEDSPPTDKAEHQRINTDTSTVVNCGRSKESSLLFKGQELSINDAASQLFKDIRLCSQTLDQAKICSQYLKAWDVQHAKILSPDTLPSAQVLQDLTDNDISYFQFAMQQSKQHQQWFQNKELSNERSNYYALAAKTSLQDQTKIEADDSVDFETFLQQYYDKNWRVSIK